MNDFFQNISYQKEWEDKNRKEKIAQKLFQNEMDVFDLSEEETEEMMGYFQKDIQEIDNELLRIKNHILDMRKQLEE